MFVKLAEMFFELDDKDSRIPGQSEEYIVHIAKPDVFIKLTQKDIDYEAAESPEEKKLNKIKLLATYRKIAEKLYLYDAITLHSATFDVDGVGVAFAAHSGTGKTTHMNLWQELLGERMTVVNGDKPIVRFFDEEPQTPYAYGTPWNGKERLGCNMRTPLRHICFIERAKENSVIKVSPEDAVNRIMNQVYMPKDPIAVMNTLTLINRLISSVNIWQINCNMDISAAKTAYNTIFNV